MNHIYPTPALRCPSCKAYVPLGVTVSTMNGNKATVESDTVCIHCGTGLTVTALVRWSATTASFAERGGKAAVEVEVT